MSTLLTLLADIVEAPPQPSLTIRVEGNVDICWVSNAFGVRADCPIPASMHQYYFEVEVIHRGVNVGYVVLFLVGQVLPRKLRY